MALLPSPRVHEIAEYPIIHSELNILSVRLSWVQKAFKIYDPMWSLRLCASLGISLCSREDEKTKAGRNKWLSSKQTKTHPSLLPSRTQLTRCFFPTTVFFQQHHHHHQHRPQGGVCHMPALGHWLIPPNIAMKWELPTPISQKKNWRVERWITHLVQDLIVCRWWMQGSNPGLRPDLEAHT